MILLATIWDHRTRGAAASPLAQLNCSYERKVSTCIWKWCSILVNVDKSAVFAKDMSCVGAASPRVCCTSPIITQCRYNELVLRWTTTETWTFERQFNVSAITLAQTNVDLLMTGVDTIAAIYVDGVSVANTSSIHR